MASAGSSSARPRRRRLPSYLLAALGLALGAAAPPLCLLCLSTGTRAAAPPKPMVLLFAGAPPAGDGAAAVAPTNPDGMPDDKRTLRAAREVRDRLAESGVAEAVLYSEDAPLFERAVIDAKLKMATPASPTPDEQLTLGKTIGATEVATVTVEPVRDKPGMIQVRLDAVDVKSRKAYSDAALAGGGSGPPAPPSGAAPPAAPAKLDGNAWATASNTLVLRFLAGPLGEYTRALAPASVLPPPPAVLPAPAPADTTNAAAPAPPVTPVPQKTPGAPPSPAPPASPSAAPPATPPAVVTPAAPASPAPSQAPHTAVQSPRPSPLSAAAATTLPPVTPGGAPQITTRSVGEQADDARQAQQQADALTAGGDVNGAVVVLRRAVDLSPRSLPLRTALARAYLAAGRANDAAAEARRALTVAAPNDDRQARLDMTRLLADVYAKNGDQTAARATYEEILAAQPQAQWARVALGDLLLKQGDEDGAEKAYRAVLQASPADKDAALGLARVQMARGDFTAAIDAVAQSGGDPASRAAFTAALFDDIATKTADSVAQNRAAFDGGQLTREAFFGATTKQSSRAGSLLSVLQAAPPPAASGVAAAKAFKHRVFAATLLSQAVDGVLAYLQKGDKGAGDEANVLLGEFRKELAAAQAPAGSAAGASPDTAAAPR